LPRSRNCSKTALRRCAPHAGPVAGRDRARAAKPAVPALAELLKDPNETVRRQAVHAVMAIRPARKSPCRWCVKLLEDSDPGVRVRVLARDCRRRRQGRARTDRSPEQRQGGVLGVPRAPRDRTAAKDAVPDWLKSSRIRARKSAARPCSPWRHGRGSDCGRSSDCRTVERQRRADRSHVSCSAKWGRIPADAEASIHTNAKSEDRLLATVSLWPWPAFIRKTRTCARQATEELVFAAEGQGRVSVRVSAARALAALPPAPEITAPIWEKACRTRRRRRCSMRWMRWRNSAPGRSRA